MPFVIDYGRASEETGLFEVSQLLELALLYIVVSESYRPSAELLFARHLIKFARAHSLLIGVSDEVLKFILVVNSTNPRETYHILRLVIEHKVLARFSGESSPYKN